MLIRSRVKCKVFSILAPSSMTASDLFVCKFGQSRSLFALMILAVVLSANARTAVAQALENFDPNVTGLTVYAMVAQPDGKTIIGGNFSSIGGTARANLARLNADGTLDAGFAPNPNNTMFTVALQPDGKFLAGGFFTTIAGQTQSNLARFNPDGSLDSSFRPEPNSLVNAVAIQPDGKILVGGSFTIIAGASRSRIARLNSDGTLDASFAAVADSSVSSFGLQPDGKIIIGGQGFAFVNGQPRTRVARLNPDGTLDETFQNPNIVGPVFSVLQQPDGKILITGNSQPGNSVGGQIRTGLARLNSDGSLDTAFNPVFVRTGSSVLMLSLALQADGKILASGSFDTANGIARNNLARLNPDGTTDESFGAVTFSNFSSVHIFLQPDGKVLLGGSFNTVNGQTRNRMARLTNPTPATQSLEITPQSVLLRRGGSAPELARVTFERSADGAAYTFLGNASRLGTSPNWILYAANLPVGANFIRARGYYFAAYFNASQTFTELVANVTLAARTAFDFDGDGRADVSVFRPAERTWYLLRSQAGASVTQWGLATDRLAPADFDGDGRTDIAVFRDGAWYILQSSNNTARFASLGAAGDIALPSDFDGDGRADLAVFRPATGTWLIASLTTGFSCSVQFGISTDKPVPADYDGDGRTDIAVFRDAVWYLLRSTSGLQVVQFGLSSDRLVPADYDGNRQADIAVYRDGTWYVRTNTGGFNAVQFGATGDVPVPADYDGDGRTDVAVFRSGVWYFQNSTAGFSAVGFGLSSDRPIPAVYIP